MITKALPALACLVAADPAMQRQLADAGGDYQWTPVARAFHWRLPGCVAARFLPEVDCVTAAVHGRPSPNDAGTGGITCAGTTAGGTGSADRLRGTTTDAAGVGMLTTGEGLQPNRQVRSDPEGDNHVVVLDSPSWMLELMDEFQHAGVLSFRCAAQDHEQGHC